MVNKPIPAHPKKILLVNPTKYLGNLLLAGGLMQSFAEHCQQQDIDLKIVIDKSFKALCEKSFPANTLIYFPRQELNKAAFFKKVGLYWNFLKKIRKFHADIAFNIEEDSATSHITRLSGAGFKLGCSQEKHRKGYDHVLSVDFENRPEDRKHRWYSFFEVFHALGLLEPEHPGYINLVLADGDSPLKDKLAALNLDFSKPLVSVHAGATKEYKKWPLEHMTELCRLLLANNYQPVLIGAGNSDELANQKIIASYKGNGEIMNLCNQFSVAELASFFQLCTFVIGNDSGPFHLASALGKPGCVIFGPTDQSIWKPLGNKSTVLQSKHECDPMCSKTHCLYQYKCLKAITPQMVFDQTIESTIVGVEEPE